MKGQGPLSLGICAMALLLLATSFLASDWVKVQKSDKGIQTGSISGKVFQPDLKACPEAKVEVKLGKWNKIKGKTDSKGMYFFSKVPAGTDYSIKASKGDLSKTVKVNVTAGKNTTVDLVLAKKK